ncbi:lipid droplet-associated protein [Pseudonocardia alaniniphila]|uniref:Lipid droplet-associated protein n=1 Tax=Pseudonocardia alaniniphila TaxID=75291 RepID=A0ABS9THW1_9PSEU|nr:lipid droplet-associated protein [Pseudonocardia alaniniphila]MCH6168120.1 lipid droplet-associated protein [Pseudonocardia alaniniphila]
MSPLPLPVRLAAGLVATAVEQARDLPRLVVEFPVTAVSQALQASMRVQQKVTELAIKGDRALGTLRPVEERPAWAVFDDEEPMERNGASTVSTLHQRSVRDAVVTLAADPAQPEAPVQTAAEVAAETATDAAPADDTATGPNVLPGYRDLTIPQLRGRLRHLTVEDLQALLDWETAHDNRPPFVTMLSNRITTVKEG